MADELRSLLSDRREALSLAQSLGQKRVKAILRQAQADLVERIHTAAGLKGPGKEPFSLTQMRVTLRQLRDVTKTVTAGLQGAILDQSTAATDKDTIATVKYLRAADKRFTGVSRRLPLREAAIIDRARAGTQSSVLRRLLGAHDPKLAQPSKADAKSAAAAALPIAPVQSMDAAAGVGILARYGAETVGRMEDRLQRGLVARKPWNEVRADLVGTSTFLQDAPGFWAERIVRTETMAASGRATWETIRGADDDLGDVCKILSATFDDRTAWDSYQVHGQIRRSDEPFEWNGKYYMHPPNRPNDREIVVPHRTSWPIPDELKWREDEEVDKAWKRDGRKGSPPSRPKMTTIELGEFGKVKAPPEAPTQVQVPEALDLPGTRAEQLMATKLKDASGSNAGGVYRGADGVERYVKLYTDPAQAHCEVIANNIYRDLGLGAKKSEAFAYNDGYAYASEMIDGEPLGHAPDKEQAREVLDGFAADVLLGNWDVVGASFDNLMPTRQYGMVRIDNGGSLLFRAKAGRKANSALMDISEWDKFFNSSVNPSYARVAQVAGVSGPADFAEGFSGVKEQIREIVALRKKNGDWGKYVDRVAPDMGPEDRAKVILMLENRTDALEKKLKELEAPKPKAITAKEGVRQVAPPRDEENLKIHRLEDLPTRKLPPHALEVPPGGEDVEEYKRKVRRQMGEMPSEVIDAMRAFTGSDYSDIRNAQRYTKEKYLAKIGGASQYDRYRRTGETLERIFELAPKEPGQVFRGIRNLDEDDRKKFLERDVLPLRATTSVSRSASTAFDFGGNSRDGILLVIHQKSAVGVETHSSHPSEKELLLSKNVQLRVLARYRAQDNPSVLIVECEEITEAPEKEEPSPQTSFDFEKEKPHAA